jgi:Tol biopolymer transport system component
MTTKRDYVSILFLICALALMPAGAEAQQFGPWSAPVNVGSPPNTLVTEDGCGAELNPSVSRDGLSLYFSAGGPGCPTGLGDFDIYVTHRSTPSGPWGQPVRLDGNINSSATDNNPTISPDGRMLVFQSNRPGGFGGLDLYISWREDKDDDFGWQPAVNLGPVINTSAGEQGGGLCEDGSGTLMLFFSSSNVATSVTLHADGSSGDRQTYPELGQSSGLTIRKDCREIFFVSKRGNTGAFVNDLWTSTRESTLDSWSAPTKQPLVNANTDNDENRPGLSWNATELYFGSNRTHEIGTPGFDLYVSSRPKLTGQGTPTGQDQH